MISISTCAFSNQTTIKTVKQYIDLGFSYIELSGGLHSSDLVKKLIMLKNETMFFVHNYFPPPENPFVFNLASSDKTIISLSIQHACKAIQLAAQLGNPIYSFHAGYLINLQPDELGKNISRRKLLNREEGLERFLEQVQFLSNVAKKEGVTLLIENNVVSQANYSQFGCNPFLMATPGETEYIMKNSPANVSLLLDIAHLKVSAKTLGFDPRKMFKICDPWVKAYHLSDNDGSADTNDPITENSWFWRHLKSGMLFYSLEFKNIKIQQLINQYHLTDRMINSIH